MAWSPIAFTASAASFSTSCRNAHAVANSCGDAALMSAAVSEQAAGKASNADWSVESHLPNPLVDPSAAEMPASVPAVLVLVFVI